jgi:hypothetical protein
VFTWISQTLAVTALNLRTIPQRLGSSGVAIIGIAGVVVVFVSVLSIAAGFSAAMEGAGSPSRALVMRTGADSEMTSGIGGPDATLIKEAPGLRRDGQTALASAELFVIIDLPKKSTGTAANVPMRGVEPTAFQVRDEVKIVEGHKRSGSHHHGCHLYIFPSRCRWPRQIINLNGIKDFQLFGMHLLLPYSFSCFLSYYFPDHQKRNHA